MAVLPVRLFTDNILHKPCELVTDFNTSELLQLSQDMLETCYAYRGVGLAANQIGIAKNLVVLCLENKTKIMILVNIKLLNHSKNSDIDREGCLSAPGVTVSMKRYKEIEIEGQLLNGEKIQLKLNGYDARIFQHEFDHIQNKCIADNIKKL